MIKQACSESTFCSHKVETASNLKADMKKSSLVKLKEFAQKIFKIYKQNACVAILNDYNMATHNIAVYIAAYISYSGSVTNHM